MDSMVGNTDSYKSYISSPSQEARACQVGILARLSRKEWPTWL